MPSLLRLLRRSIRAAYAERTLSLGVGAAAGCIAVLTGCGEPPVGGGATSVPEVRLRVAELDDEDVPTQPASESKAEVVVLGPTGEAIVPPEQRTEIDDAAEADAVADAVADE